MGGQNLAPCREIAGYGLRNPISTNLFVKWLLQRFSKNAPADNYVFRWVGKLFAKVFLYKEL